MPNPIPDLADIDPSHVTETSTDGTVRVSVDSRGVPTELTLTNRAQGVDPARLSAELMSCLRRAHSTLASHVSNHVTSSVPNNGDSGDHAAGDDDPSVSGLLC